MPLPAIDEQDIPVIFAALCAMVGGNHSPQDQLSHFQWDRAKALYEKFEAAVNAERIFRDVGHKGST